MAPLQNAYRPNDLRNAIVDCHLNDLSIRDAPAKYRVPSRVLRQSLNDLATICAIRIASGQIGLIEDDEQKQVYRWATKFTRASSKNGDLYTTWEIRASCDTMPPAKHSRLTVTTTEAELSLEELKRVPTDLKTIEARADQIWNCDEIGIEPNDKWYQIVCTYKWCTADKIWKTQTGERAPFWYTVLFFSRGDGQCFIAPTVVHQAAELTGDLLLGLPGNWVSHATPSGYMDRDGWYKTIDNFSNYPEQAQEILNSFSLTVMTPIGMLTPWT
jgi:hypothetical protein